MKISKSFRAISKAGTQPPNNEGEAAIIVVQGSQGAGKTFSILQRWILLALISDAPQHCTIVSNTLPNLKIGAIKDFETICAKEGIERSGTRSPYVMRIGSWTFEFFSVDIETKGLGGRRDRLFINEGNRISWKIARQLISRTHVEFLVDFNPSSEFWAHEQFVNTNLCQFLKLTYKDNEYLPKGEIAAIERHAPWGAVPDENYWRVFGLGEIGFVEGMILKGYKTFRDLPKDENLQGAIGVDWGGRDPLTATKVYVNHDNMQIYWIELFYMAGSSDVEVADVPIGSWSLLKDAILGSEYYDSDIIACDHEPVPINYLRKEGLSAIAANKKAGIVADIRLIRQYTLNIHEASSNLISEVDNWKYQEKKGKIIEYPDQTCEEHAIDAGRYGTTIIIRN